MRLSEAILEYETFRVSQRYAKNTVRTERQALDLLLSEVGNIQLKHLDSRHGEAFVAALLSRGFKPGTVNLYRGAFRRFCAWCNTRRYLPGGNNPLGTTRNLADHAPPRRRIPVADFTSLLDATEHAQERIIVALGLYLFLRASEVSFVDVEHVKLDGLAARVEAGGTLRDAKARFERDWISAVLMKHHGRVGEAAKALGIQRTNLYRKVRQLKVARTLLGPRRPAP